ncbi:hypothetical protein [Actinomadura sp. DC4]|uniref:hypothetical protein n=1 Tax=Actinomadura sp. DC4 TaxID=3055069 RepID=UPI0025B0BCD2|nr:hypothetical protein [Actinomadura sp. DC4]MDN3354925.1 hypothetical protein [Actinomadura sp. DC4]
MALEPRYHRTAWTTVGLMHTGMWLTAPTLAVVITLLEAVLTVTVVVTALYAPPRASTRAFRLLPWTAPGRSRDRRETHR